MEFITNEKLTIVGAAGMIGSNMAQTAIMMHLTPNICFIRPLCSRSGRCGGRNVPLRIRRPEPDIHIRH